MTLPTDLTTVASAANWAQITIPNPDKNNIAATLQGCLSAASVDFLRRTGRGGANSLNPDGSPFAESIDYTETYNGNGNDTIVLRNFPVTAIASLTANGLAIPASTGSSSAGYAIGRTARSVVLLNGGGNTADTFYGYPGGNYPTFGQRGGFPRGVNNIVISYTAGFPAQTITDELDTIPAAAPYIIAVQALINGNAWLSDVEVKFFSDGTPLTKVNVSPGPGEYYLLGGGQYQFNAADAGKEVLITYKVTGTPPDIIQAINQMVALNYKRRNWIGQRSVAMKDVGSTSYTLLLDPMIRETISNYERGSF